MNDCNYEMQSFIPPWGNNNMNLNDTPKATISRCINIKTSSYDNKAKFQKENIYNSKYELY